MGNFFSCNIFGNTTKEEEIPQSPITTAPENAITSGTVAQQVCFGAGCYWGTEKYFRKEFNKLYPGAVKDGLVGFMGPASAPKNPGYKEVCSGTTGHVEVYRLEFDGTPEMFENLVYYFFQFHDPTTLNSQGNDKGTQYASYIFCYDDAQVAIARRVLAKVQEWLTNGQINKKQYSGSAITTEIRHVRDCSEFYAAHEEHQRYLELHPRGYCNHRIRIKQWPVEADVTAKKAAAGGGDVLFISANTQPQPNSSVQ